jgi:hypothetical protein
MVRTPVAVPVTTRSDRIYRMAGSRSFSDAIGLFAEGTAPVPDATVRIAVMSATDAADAIVTVTEIGWKRRSDRMRRSMSGSVFGFAF